LEEIRGSLGLGGALGYAEGCLVPPVGAETFEFCVRGRASEQRGVEKTADCGQGLETI
jgi:hypothetical protein